MLCTCSFFFTLSLSCGHPSAAHEQYTIFSFVAPRFPWYEVCPHWFSGSTDGNNHLMIGVGALRIGADRAEQMDKTGAVWHQTVLPVSSYDNNNNNKTSMRR